MTKRQVCLLAYGPRCPSSWPDGMSASLEGGQEEAISQGRSLFYQSSMSKGTSSHLQLASVLESPREVGLGTESSESCHLGQLPPETLARIMLFQMSSLIIISFFLPLMTTTKNDFDSHLLANDSQISKYLPPSLACLSSWMGTFVSIYLLSIHLPLNC